MRHRLRATAAASAAFTLTILLCISNGSAAFVLAGEDLVLSADTAIAVPGYSVPSFVRWDGDDLPDLVVGQGGFGYGPGKVRVYLNTGSPGAPRFDDGFVHVRAAGVEIASQEGGCMGIFPRVVDADGDGRTDLLCGEAEGFIRLYTNTGTDDAPVFDAGRYLEVGEPGAKAIIDVGQRPTPIVVDWDLDGRRDLLVGAKDGYLRIFRNEGTDAAWDFRGSALVLENGSPMFVPTARPSPQLTDLDGDGRRDLLVGNTEGNILFYPNVGSNDDPAFSGFTYVEAGGETIDLPFTPRARPFLCDWNGDGRVDLLVGSSPGNVRVYLNIDTTTGVADGLPPAGLPARLDAPWPNPFNPVVTVPFVLERRQRVRITVLDARGALVAVLVDGERPAGVHEVRWTGGGAGGGARSGVYLVRMQSAAGAFSRKIVLLR
ncbi:MAG: VCBS repeat-containing protein [Candidatus Krumholzibacteriota bacterium]|nr:VCBS repeat-containing protein [Candidatus Krumholzibacteriota bacterium]